VLATGLGGGLVSAEALAARFAPAAEESTVVDRATVDRTWTYGHVVVDEAQELSSMAWRAVLRRVPSRSMTVVGDTAQTSALAGSASWTQAFRQLRDEQWRVCELTVNYRTPAPVMEVAAALLVEAGIDAHPPRAARTGLPPTLVGVPQVDVTAVERVVAGELEVLGGGTLAVIFPAAGYEQLRHQLRDRWSATAAAAGGAEALVLLDVREAKGLEFDTVGVVEPADVIDQSQRGVRDLYVALTRCTQRLVVVHARPLPAAVAADKGRAMR
jgi:DNA helicase IV